MLRDPLVLAGAQQGEGTCELLQLALTNSAFQRLSAGAPTYYIYMHVTCTYAFFRHLRIY